MQYVVTNARGRVIESVNCEITARTSAEQNCILNGTPCMVFYPRIGNSRRRADRVSLMEKKLVWQEGSCP